MNLHIECDVNLEFKGYTLQEIFFFADGIPEGVCREDGKADPIFATQKHNAIGEEGIHNSCEVWNRNAFISKRKTMWSTIDIQETMGKESEIMVAKVGSVLVLNFAVWD